MKPPSSNFVGLFWTFGWIFFRYTFHLRAAEIFCALSRYFEFFEIPDLYVHSNFSETEVPCLLCNGVYNACIVRKSFITKFHWVINNFVAIKISFLITKGPPANILSLTVVQLGRSRLVAY